MGIKVLHINTSDSGGAAIAAIRIHLGLLQNGIESSYLSLYKTKGGIPSHVAYDGPVKNTKPDYPVLTLKNVLREKLTHHYQKDMSEYLRKTEEAKKVKTPTMINGFSSFGLFSSPESIFDITKTKAYQEADIIHLHWVADFIDYPSFFRQNKKPVIWTLHDANPYRGGFHHEDDEIRNEKTHKFIDDQYKQIKKESIAYQDKMTVVSPSLWLAKEALKSEMFVSKKVTTIRNGIDLRIFKPYDKNWAKNFFNIPSTKTTFLFASHDIQDYRKGLDLLLPLISCDQFKDVTFILAGSYSSVFNQENVLVLGSISDQRLMSLVYAASDFFLLTSRTDNLPNTMVEAIASGTPVIGFPIGDSKEIIEDQGCGFIADEVSTAGLEKVMLKAMDAENKFDSHKLRAFAEKNFDQNEQGKLYITEYRQLLK